MSAMPKLSDVWYGRNWHGSDDNVWTRSLGLREALAELPDDQRNVLVLRHVVGLTPGEIAGRLGKSEPSIHGLHHRGRRALQRELRRLESTPCTRQRRRVAAA